MTFFCINWLNNLKIMKKLITLNLILLTILSTGFSQWKDLFNGKDLSGWKVEGGKAEYRVEDGSIVGSTALKGPNTFLVTEEKYNDFVLELKFYTDTQLNSGIQFRSNLKDKAPHNVNGYQMEIDPSTRAWTGGIYDESRRGWIYPLSRNQKAQSALKMGAWNEVHIEAIGNTLNTWINGVHCARLVDDMTAEGFIGLQVHGIGGNLALKDAEIKWKDIRLATSDFDKVLFQKDPQTPEISYLDNSLTEWEQRQGFRMLWDGKTSDGWRGAFMNDFPEKGWKIEDGVLSVIGSNGGEAGGGGDIVTRQNFSNFELTLEFRITNGANSGVKYFVNPAIGTASKSAIGLEFQILDDRKHPDAQKGVNGNRTVASLYDLIPADNMTTPGRGKQFKGVGNWNHLRIVSNNGVVEHWLNNEKVLEYDRFSPAFKALVSYSKYANWENFGQYTEGPILLQDHGDDVSFKNIKIREW